MTISLFVMATVCTQVMKTMILHSAIDPVKKPVKNVGKQFYPVFQGGWGNFPASIKRHRVYNLRK